MAADYIGDFLSGDTIEVKYFSFNSLGASTTPSSIGSVIVYKAGSVTETSVGVSAHSIGWDGKPGVNYVQIASTASPGFYAPGTDFVAIASGTSLDGQFVNLPVCSFSIQNRYAPGLIHRGVAGGGAAGSITLDSAARSAVTDLYSGAAAYLSAATGVGQGREGTAYAGATGVMSVGRNWTTNPASGTSYELYAGQASFTTTEIQSGLVTETVLNSGVTVTSIANDVITASAIADDAIGSAELAAGAITEIQAGLATTAQLNSGVTVTSIANNAITAAAIAADAIGASELAADAVTEIQSGLATTANLNSGLTVTSLSASALSTVADALLSRTISGGAQGGRDVTSALRGIRNRVQVGTSIATVFQENDSTSAWTASVTTAEFPLSSVDPG